MIIKGYMIDMPEQIPVVTRNGFLFINKKLFEGFNDFAVWQVRQKELIRVEDAIA